MPEKKYPNRFTDDPKARLIPCSNCKYRVQLKPACEAYLDGIPREVLLQVLKDPKKECKAGYRYIPKKEV